MLPSGLGAADPSARRTWEQMMDVTHSLRWAGGHMVSTWNLLSARLNPPPPALTASGRTSQPASDPPLCSVLAGNHGDRQGKQTHLQGGRESLAEPKPVPLGCQDFDGTGDH